jgi:hypothetical protein
MIPFLLLVDFVMVDLLGSALVLGPADDLVTLATLPDFKVDVGCEDESLSKVGAKYTGGNAGCVDDSALLGGLDGPTCLFSFILSSIGFVTLTNRSIAPFGIPPFVAAFFAADFALMNFLGSRSDSS